jgi:hypothetical protein
LVCAVLVAVAGCDPGAGDADVLDLADLGAADTSTPEVLDAAGPDGDPALDAAPDDPGAVPTPEPAFVVGTNTFGVSDPTQFAPLADGSDLRVEKGTQGAWMVVLAVQTAGLLTGDVALKARLWVDGVDEGGVVRTGLKPFPAPDGYAYLFSLPLIVDGPELAGQDATLVVEASGASSGTASQTLAIHLTGGTAP